MARLITKIEAKENMDYRGKPALEVNIVLENGTTGKLIYPTSDQVANAVEDVNHIIAPQIIGFDAFDQQDIDRKLVELNGDRIKGKLNLHSISAVSQAVTKTAEAYLKTFK